jgi:hypothetical protein
MKASIWCCLAVALAMSAQVLWAASRGEPGGPGEYRDFKVTKSYYAQDGEYAFRAFVIGWESQEVVAMDAGSLIKARSDDTINVLISRGVPGPGQDRGRIVFLARPEKRPPGGHFPATAERPQVTQVAVKKVYALKEGEYSHRAYEVEWKGMDVVVFDSVPATSYEAGDLITVAVSKQLYDYRGNTNGILRFTLRPSRAARVR